MFTLNGVNRHAESHEVGVRGYMPVHLHSGEHARGGKGCNLAPGAFLANRYKKSSFSHSVFLRMAEDDAQEAIQLGKRTLDAIIEGIAAKLWKGSSQKTPQPSSTDTGEGEFLSTASPGPRQGVTLSREGLQPACWQRGCSGPHRARPQQHGTGYRIARPQ